MNGKQVRFTTKTVSKTDGIIAVLRAHLGKSCKDDTAQDLQPNLAVMVSLKKVFFEGAITARFLILPCNVLNSF